ncbi:Paxillin [Choanephora cucurbitarum]|uniref:Paxillin n=1 Tax=Choanephora cucurbitarum TaxID=101091 RepID=A0A1C7NPV6_9FUNG|nr:Paxillin [Choanephora cucurbitarum]
MNYHNQETSYRSLQGPRPFQQNIGYTPRQPRKPLMVRVPPTRKEIPPQHYHYPPPRPYERRESKIEVDLTDEPLSPVSSVPSLSKTATDSDEEDVVSPKAVIETKHSKKLPPRPNSEPKEATKRLVHVSSFSSYSDDEDEDEINDEAILQELSLSRKKSVHDITISDDEDKEEEDDSDSTYDEIYPSSSLQRSESTHTQKNGLPPIPIISAPDDVPSIPILCVPDQEQPKTTPQKKNDRLLSSIFFGGIRCDGCDQPLSGQAITTSGKRWHTHCFQCQACHQNLEHIAFYEKEGLPYCALDYHELFSPRCDFCKTPIEEHSISAIGKTYHPGHFFCRECGKPFDEETDFLEHEGHAYCERDYYKQFGKKCRGCEETITGDFLVALGGDWHKECFVCAECGCTFTSSTFLIRSGKPYCELHHAARMSPSSSTLSSKSSRVTSMRSALPQFDLLPDIKPLEETKSCKSCHRCQKPIEGRSISAFGYDYHPLHFQCAQCNKILSVRLPGLYQETERGNIICKPCIRKNKTS